MRIGPLRSSSVVIAWRVVASFLLPLIGAGLFLWWLAGQPHPAWLAVGLAIWLSWITVIDLRRQVIPNLMSYPLILAGLLVSGLPSQPGWPAALLGMSLGGGGFALLVLYYERIRGLNALGWGDVKLAAAIGAWLGWIALPLGLAIGALIGLFLAVPRLLRGSDWRTLKLSFGPALCAGFWLVWLFRTELQLLLNGVSGAL